MAEYLKPWKLIAFIGGLLVLIAGSRLTPAPDWDIPVSIIMATATYIFHPYALRFKNFDEVMGSIAAMYLSVDGFYAIYWAIENPLVLQLMRSANAPASACLYLVAVLYWNYAGRVCTTLGRIYSSIQLQFLLLRQLHLDGVVQKTDQSVNPNPLPSAASTSPIGTSAQLHRNLDLTWGCQNRPHEQRLDVHNRQAGSAHLWMDSPSASQATPCVVRSQDFSQYIPEASGQDQPS